MPSWGKKALRLGLSGVFAATAMVLSSSAFAWTATTTFNGTSPYYSGDELDLVIALTNDPGEAELTGVTLNSTSLSGLLIAGSGGTSTCTGVSINATDGSDSFSFSGATVPAGDKCTVTLKVKVNENPAGPKTYSTTLSEVKGTRGGSSVSATGDATATLTVNNLPDLKVTKVFSPTSITMGETSRVTISIENPSSR